MRPVATVNLADSNAPTAMTAAGKLLRHVFLLAGAPKPGGFLARLGCSVLDLPVDGETDLLDLWCERLRAALGKERIAQTVVQVVCDPNTPLPRDVEPRGNGIHIAFRRDNRPHRGTGGALRDAIDRTAAADHEFALVLPAAQFPSLALTALILRALDVDADAIVICAGDDAPPIGFIIRCGLLRTIRNAGYIDLKEQALAQFAKQHKVCVVRATDVAAQHIASLEDYLEALAAMAATDDRPGTIADANGELGEVSIDCTSQAGDGVADILIDTPAAPSELDRPKRGPIARLTHRPVMRDAFARLDGRSRFAIVQAGAVAEDGAVLHDAVALAGSVVHRGAIVARSVLTSGAIVGPGEIVVDRLVTASYKPVALDV